MKRPVFPILVLALLLSACEKTRLDEQAKDLCAKDGGIIVHETVKLPAERFDKYGQTRLRSKELSKSTDEFFYEWDVTYLRKGDPDLLRHHVKLVRRADGKLLGESVSYTRRGGDGVLSLLAHPSSFSCPSDAGLNSLERRVFERTEGRKANE